MSEKTLETNVLADLLPLIRQLPGCKAAYWIGMKQAQEAINGIDDLISNVPRGFHLALQFKAARPHPKDGNPFFHFNTSELQHSSLLKLALRRPNVYYVLPQVNTFSSLSAISPNLISNTYWLRVSSLAFLPRGAHRVWTNPAETWVESEVTQIDRLDSEAVLTRLHNDFETARSFGNVDQQDRAAALNSLGLISHEDLRAWLSEIFEEVRYDARTISQRLRGFSTICMVPQ